MFRNLKNGGGKIKQFLFFKFVVTGFKFFKGLSVIIGFRGIFGFIDIVGFTGIIGFTGVVGFTCIIGLVEEENNPDTWPFKLTNFKCNNPYSSNLNSIFLEVNSV